ncbi:MAG: PD-(D/E)XK nuclease family protein [Armatimonadetes bacterium]|nr:PD-(D/E)XK nuclease family protein [Armatimonadota bacterium]
MDPGETSRYALFPNLSWLGMRRFRDCERRWYNAHAVNKIDHGKTELHWALHREGRLAPWNTITGSSVDKAITAALRCRRNGEPWPDDLPQVAADHVDGFIAFSRKWADAVRSRQKWPRSEYQPLDRIYYGDEPTVQELKDVRDRARECTARFEQGEVKRFIFEQNPATLVVPPAEGEGIPWTTIDGVPTYTSYDFIVRTEEEVTIFDWKTGRLTELSEKKAVMQLHIYALYAINEWGVQQERIRLVPVWLSVSGDMHSFPVQQSVLDRVVLDLRKTYDVLFERMERTGANIAAMEQDFPLTDDLRECGRCMFRSCEGYRRLQAKVDEDNPFAGE